MAFAVYRRVASYLREHKPRVGALLVCCACERQRIIEKINRNNYVCSNCGARNALIIRRRNLWASWTEKSGKIKTEAMRETYAGLKKIAEFKKYSPKWPLPKFKSIFGTWPPDEVIDVLPYAPSKALLVWIAKSNEQWKKAKRLEEKNRQPEVSLRLPESGENEMNNSLMTEEDWQVKL